jgi:phage tail tape-measure protein
MAGASGALDMAITAKANEGLLTGKERKANTMQMAAKGASTGAAIGSVIPGVGTLIGGAAGAVIGGATGYLSHMGDEKKLRKKNKEAEAIAYQKQVTDREEAQKLYDAGEQVQAKKNILKSQMGILGSNYNSKNV